MKQILTEVNQTYKLISSLLVSGDAADTVAAARALLRDVKIRCEEKIREEEELKKESENTPVEED